MVCRCCIVDVACLFFKPYMPVGCITDLANITLSDSDGAVTRLSQLIQYRTVSDSQEAGSHARHPEQLRLAREHLPTDMEILDSRDSKCKPHSLYFVAITGMTSDRAMLTGSRAQPVDQMAREGPSIRSSIVCKPSGCCSCN